MCHFRLGGKFIREKEWKLGQKDYLKGYSSQPITLHYLYVTNDIHFATIKYTQIPCKDTSRPMKWGGESVMITGIILNRYKVVGDGAVMWYKIIIISYNYVVVLSLCFEERLQSYLKEKHREKVCETVWIKSKANTFIGGLHNSAAIAGVRFESRTCRCIFNTSLSQNNGGVSREERLFVCVRDRYYKREQRVYWEREAQMAVGVFSDGLLWSEQDSERTCSIAQRRAPSHYSNIYK